MQPKMYEKGKFTDKVLDQLLTALIQLRSDKAFVFIEDMIRCGVRPHVKQYLITICWSYSLILIIFALLNEINAEQHKWDACFQFLDCINSDPNHASFFDFANL